MRCLNDVSLWQTYITAHQTDCQGRLYCKNQVRIKSIEEVKASGAGLSVFVLSHGRVKRHALAAEMGTFSNKFTWTIKSE